MFMRMPIASALIQSQTNRFTPFQNSTVLHIRNDYANAAHGPTILPPFMAMGRVRSWINECNRNVYANAVIIQVRIRAMHNAYAFAMFMRMQNAYA